MHSGQRGRQDLKHHVHLFGHWVLIEHENLARGFIASNGHTCLIFIPYLPIASEIVKCIEWAGSTRGCLVFT